MTTLSLSHAELVSASHHLGKEIPKQVRDDGWAVFVMTYPLVIASRRRGNPENRLDRHIALRRLAMLEERRVLKERQHVPKGGKKNN